MKCPECRRNHKYRDGMRCRCGYGFVLNPKRDGMSDGRMLALCRQSSSNGTYAFTLNQLTTAFCRREMRGRRTQALVVCVVGLLGAGASFFFRDSFTALWWWYGVGVSLFIATVFPLILLTEKPKQARFRTIVERWLASGRPLPKLLVEPSLHEPPPQWDEPDIYDYGVESILVVQRDLLVDLLVNNEFHASQRCLVISETGYPAYLMPKAAELLTQRPDLPVFLLHDATPVGTGMLRRMQDRPLAANLNASLHDLGLFPQDVARLAKLRPTLRRSGDYALAVDCIPYAMLVSGLSQAIDQRVSLADIIDARQAHGANSGAHDTGGFG